MADERRQPAPQPGLSVRRRALGGHTWAISVSYSGRPRTPAQERRRVIVWWACLALGYAAVWALLLVRALHGQAVDPLVVASIAAAQIFALAVQLWLRREARKRGISAPEPTA